MSTAADPVLKESLRRGWCPGAWRPMRTGDGLLVRLRVTGGILPAGQARALADAAEAFGNGLLDLSGRGNLQVRGVEDATLPGLMDRLAALGLLDEDPEAEAVRNVIASPLAGFSQGALLDIRPVVRALEARLVAEPDLRALPGKFGVLVDDGGSPSLERIAADIRFRAARSQGGVGFAVVLGGDAPTAFTSFCSPEDVPDAAVRLARAFLALGATLTAPPRRMAALVREIGAAMVRDAAALAKPAADVAVSAHGAGAPFGVLPLEAGVALGVGAPFGRWSAADLRDLAGIAERDALGELRLSPFRAILVPGLDAARARGLSQALSGRFIFSPSDPRLSVAACAGAPACANASTATHDDALALASVAAAQGGDGVVVHVSGCIKGCAHPGPAPATLVGRAGRYDLVLRGAAADAPARRDLTLEEAVAALVAMRRGKDDSACPQR